ncbi:cytokine receptor common subunit beta [Heptranchias perlo]|uniref:cytokine receptor common subunit beta n=1 Tax=Heptranchias perlo TaxID=212740 RepID=UPI00355A4B4E
MFGKERTSFLCLTSALVLITVHCAEKGHDITSSLQCYTDYISKIDCQWAENTMARHYIPMDLYYEKVVPTALTNHSQEKCILSGAPENVSSSYLNWWCTIKENNYVVAFKYNYTFKPERPVNLGKTFRLLENIKPQPPRNLSLTVMEKGDYLLVWQTVYTRDPPNMLFGKLQYEINYRRTWESWENSVTETVSEDNQQFQIRKSFLATMNTYIARVRAKPQQNSSYRGHWSEWSTEIQWNTTHDANVSQTAKTEVMPRNLQCAYDGVREIECTWEVTRESSRYFEFNLHYGKANSPETKECKPSVIVNTFSHLTVHRCNIPVDGQEALADYKVLLKLSEPAITFEPFRNIKTNAPFNLTIKQLPDRRYQLNWLTVEAKYQSEYEIYYKKDEDSWENSKVKKLPQETNSYSFPKDSMDASSRYHIRMRAKVRCRGDPHCYRGPWSDWSKMVTLKTDPDTQMFVTLMYVFPIILITLIPPLYCLIRRQKRSWLDSIPDPAKSKLFRKECQEGLLGQSALVEIIVFDEGNICQVVTNESADALLQVISKEKAEFNQEEEKLDIFSLLMTRDSIDQKQPNQEVVTTTETEAPSGEVFPNFQNEPADYNGPYLFNFQDLPSVPNSLSESKKGFNKNECYSKHGQEAPGYVKLPQDSSESLQELNQTNSEQSPSLPTSAYVLSPPQAMFSSPLPSSATGYHIHTDNTARASLSQSVLEQPFTSSYVLCPPHTNSVPTSLPEVFTGYVHTKDTDIPCSSQPVRGSDTFATPTVSQQSAVSDCGADPLLECIIPKVNDKNTQDSPSFCNVSREDPAGMPGCSGYVLTPPGEEVVYSSIPPEVPKSSKHEDQSLLADQQQIISPEALIRKMTTELPYLSKLQVDTQKPTTKEQDLSLADIMQNEAPNVILYQQGAKPILLQQVGDYCFIPGSHSSNINGFTKWHLSPSLKYNQPANKQSVIHCIA